jgi:hypothetical protein
MLNPCYNSWLRVISKYLWEPERSTPHTSTANIKLEAGEELRTVRVGSEFLTTSTCVEMVERSKVLRIMLAKPTNVVMMIAIERIPPVTVRYYCSSSYLNISVEQKKSVHFRILLNLDNIA